MYAVSLNTSRKLAIGVSRMLNMQIAVHERLPDLMRSGYHLAVMSAQVRLYRSAQDEMHLGNYTCQHGGAAMVLKFGMGH